VLVLLVLVLELILNKGSNLAQHMHERSGDREKHVLCFPHMHTAGVRVRIPSPSGAQIVVSNKALASTMSVPRQTCQVVDESSAETKRYGSTTA
jgi:hypothetical protein